MTLFGIDSLLDGKVSYIGEVPVLKRYQIERISEHILESYMPRASADIAPTNIEFLIESAFDLRLEFKTLQPDGGILGETIFRDGYREVFAGDNCVRSEIIKVQTGTIILDEAMSDTMTARTSFTEAHELGHWVLHQGFYGSTHNRACRSSRLQKLHFSHHQAKTPIQWTEWQANTFAAAILLPRTALRTMLRAFLDESKLTWKELSDFSKHRNRECYIKLLDRIALVFQVSRETARLRMNKLCNLNYPN